jgi:hypothetical protein
MKNASDTRFDAFQSGVRAVVRTGRAGRTAVEWSAPRVAALYLQKDLQGRTCVVALQDEDFAEFDPRHCMEDDGSLVAEDYYLEVQKLPA